jgi:hypothetical protein
MRAVFTINLPIGEKTHPTDDFVKRLEHSWGITSMTEAEAAEKAKGYRAFAEDFFKHAPEVAKEELDYVVFCGLVAADRTKIVVTRQTAPQAKFRLLQEDLERLQRSTKTVIFELFEHYGFGRASTIEENEVVIYEKGFENKMIIGRVIARPVLEALKADKKNAFLTIAFSVLVLPALGFLYVLRPASHPHMVETLQRFTPPLLSALVVSAVAFLQTFFSLWKKKLIEWHVGTVQLE